MYSSIRSPTTNYYSTSRRDQTEYWTRKSIANYGLLTCLCKGNYFPSESVAQGWKCYFPFCSGKGPCGELNSKPHHLTGWAQCRHHCKGKSRSAARHACALPCRLRSCLPQPGYPCLCPRSCLRNRGGHIYIYWCPLKPEQCDQN